MSDYCVVKTTFANKKDAQKMAQKLLQNKLAACGQISTIESLYLWGGQIEQENEFLLAIKTRKNLFAKVKKMIMQSHEYEVPQIVMLPILDADEQYLAWVDSCLN